MESWLQRLLLISVLASWALPAAAQDETTEDENRTILDGVINPDIKRREVDESLIDSENFEFGFYGGVMSVEDFGSNNSYGVRLAYHVSEDWFLETTYGSTKTSKTSFEVLSGGSDLLTEEERDLSYYNLSLGLNLLPGEIFIREDYAFNITAYVIGGLGNTQFAGDEFFTINYGAGLKVFPTDWVSIRLGFRNHLFTHNIFGVDKSIQNLESHLGLSLYF